MQQKKTDSENNKKEGRQRVSCWTWKTVVGSPHRRYLDGGPHTERKRKNKRRWVRNEKKKKNVEIELVSEKHEKLGENNMENI